MLALRQTPSHCDSVVHLHNVPSAHPPTRGRHGGCTDRMANTCSGECDPPEETKTSTYVNHGGAAAYIKILTLHCVRALRAAVTNSTLIILCQPAFHIHIPLINASEHHSWRVSAFDGRFRRFWAEVCLSYWGLVSRPLTPIRLTYDRF